jgi:glycosyltransferase involved in cell wall biosynthesis
MRVLHVIGQLAPGGSEKMTLQVAKGLTLRGEDHRIAVLREVDMEFVAGLGAAGIPLYRIDGRGGQPGRLVQLARLARRLDVDLVQGHAWRSSVAAGLVARAASVPAIATLHRIYYARLEETLDRMLQRMWEAVIVDSNAVRDLLVQTVGMDTGRVKVIPNFVSEEVLRAGDAPRAERPAEPLRLLMAAHFSEVKGHRFLLEALAELGDRRERFELDLLGDGPLLEEMQSLAARLGLADRIRFRGRRSDLSAWLSRADVVVLPSLWEGFGMILAEAAAFRLPAVAFGIGGAAEVVVDGETGVLVPPRDVAALAAALDRLLDPALRARLGAAARTRAERLYSPEGALDSYQALYRSTRRR